MLPIISIVGAKNVGKTTVTEMLVAELTRRGHRVATMKRSLHGFELDHPGTDSARHRQAGAVAVALRSPREYAILGQANDEPSFWRLAAFLLEEADLLVVEGFSELPLPKIEVVRKEIGTAPLHREEKLIAIVSDVPGIWAGPSFGLTEAAPLADFVEERLSKFHGEVSLTVDGQQIGINDFVDSILAATVRGMISPLRGIPPNPERITLHLRRRR